MEEKTLTIKEFGLKMAPFIKIKNIHFKSILKLLLDLTLILIIDTKNV